MMHEEQKNNSCFTVKNKKIILESTKGIKPNEEIYADYGCDYWPCVYRGKKRQRGGILRKRQRQTTNKILKEIAKAKTYITNVAKKGVLK